MVDLPWLSLFHKILVFVEDRREVTVSELKELGRIREVLGALGRLEALGLIARPVSRLAGGEAVVLSDKGDQTLASLLEFVPQPSEAWDEKWRIIFFDIPSPKRSLRQMLCLKLFDLGARRLHAGVWITPKAAVIEQFGDFLHDHQLNGHIHSFEAVAVPPGEIDLRGLWRLDDLAVEYDRLFRTFRQLIPSLTNGPLTTYRAKCMVTALALVAKKDPTLPGPIMARGWIGQAAPDWYSRLRPYCQKPALASRPKS